MWFDFGRLRQLRREKHLTQSEAGKLIGCTKTTLGRWERGEVPITVEDLLRASKIYSDTNFQLFFVERLG